MTTQIKAELLKIRTTRTAIALILAMVALTLLITLLTGLPHQCYSATQAA
jgi:hypothetical protein